MNFLFICIRQFALDIMLFLFLLYFFPDMNLLPILFVFIGNLAGAILVYFTDIKNKE